MTADQLKQQAALAALMARQPTGRLVSPEQVAHAVCYLASPLACATPGRGIRGPTGSRISWGTVSDEPTETPADGVDQNCDGVELCYADADNDNYRLGTTVNSSDTDCADSGEALATDPTTRWSTS